MARIQNTRLKGGKLATPDVSQEEENMINLSSQHLTDIKRKELNLGFGLVPTPQ